MAPRLANCISGDATAMNASISSASHINSERSLAYARSNPSRTFTFNGPSLAAHDNTRARIVTRLSASRGFSEENLSCHLMISARNSLSSKARKGQFPYSASQNLMTRVYSFFVLSASRRHCFVFSKSRIRPDSVPALRCWVDCCAAAKLAKNSAEPGSPARRLPVARW